MKCDSHLVVAVLWRCVVVPAWAQFKQGEPGGAKVGKSQTSQWRTGMIVKASGGACRGLVGYVPVPTDWPEQQVSIVKEDISPEAKIHYETVDGGVKIMNVRIGQLAAGQEAKALVTVEICRNAICRPRTPTSTCFPTLKKLPREMRPYLLPSPKIESRDPKIRELAKKIGADKKRPGTRSRRSTTGSASKVKYQNGPLKGAWLL